MAKKKVTKTNALRLLEQKKIAYEERTFEVDEDHHQSAQALAQRLNLAPETIYKTLVVVGNKTGPIVAVIPSNQVLDMKKLAKVSQNKKVELLHLKELEPLTGYVRGGCSPVGMKKLFPTYIEEKGKSIPYVYVSAGRRGLQMKIAPDDLQRVTKGIFVDIVESKEEE